LDIDILFSFFGNLISKMGNPDGENLNGVNPNWIRVLEDLRKLDLQAQVDFVHNLANQGVKEYLFETETNIKFSEREDIRKSREAIENGQEPEFFLVVGDFRCYVWGLGVLGWGDL
jgi:hypothetical protein